jgi:hypothetical protein
MKKLFLIIKIMMMFFCLPFEISNGSKKKALQKIKKTMISANLI